jgi:predicted transcriptional regulator
MGSPIKSPQKQAHRGQTGPKGIPVGLAVEYAALGLTQAEIAKLLGVSVPSISKLLKPHKQALASLDAYRARRADVMCLMGRELLYSLGPAEIKAMPPASRVTAAAILFDKERLERGQSTANVEYSAFDKKIKVLDNEIVELESRLIDGGLSPALVSDYEVGAGGDDSEGPG